MFLAFMLWFYIAVLYIAARHKAIALYFILLPFFPFYWAPFYIVPFNFLNVSRFMAIGIMGGMVIKFFSNIRRGQANKLILRIEHFLLFMCVMWHLSLFEITTVSNWIRTIVFSILDFWFPFYAGVLLAKDGKVESIFKSIVWSTSIASLFIFYEFLSQSPIVYNFFDSIPIGTIPYDISGFHPSFRVDALRVQGGFAQPIFAGFYMCCASFMAFLLSNIESVDKKVRYFFLCGELFIASLLPMARGALSGFIGAIFVFLLFATKMSRRKIIFWVGILVILIWVASYYSEGVKGFWTDFILTVIGKAPVSIQSEQLLNWEGRLEVIQKGIDLMLKGPLLGYGDISFGGAWIIRDICNVFIQVALQAGILGLILLITFLIFIFMQWLQLWKREKEKKRAVLAVGLIGCYVIVLASWMGSSWPGQFTQIGWFIFGLIYGMNLSHRKLISSEYVSDPNKWTR